MARKRLRTTLLWSLVDQACSSAATFGLTVIAAQSLGPAGLGTVAVGFAGYLVCLGLLRALIIVPLMAERSSADSSRHLAIRPALTLCVFGALALTAIMAMLGLASDGTWARGLLLFAPWVAPGLIHALLKAWLYRESRGHVAALSSALWLAVMLLGATLWLHGSANQVVAAWGVGALAASGLLWINVPSASLSRARNARAWFTREAAPLGGWLLMSSVIFNVLAYSRVSALSSIIGPAQLGGIRAIETAFAPVSLTGEALFNAGLPALRESIEQDNAAAWGLARKLAALNLAMVVTYIAVVALFRDKVVLIFGESFSEFTPLILPVAVAQVVASISTVLVNFLTVARMTKAVASRTLMAGVLSLALALPLGAYAGAEGAAWGIAIAGLPSLALLVVVSRRVGHTPSGGHASRRPA